MLHVINTIMPRIITIIYALGLIGNSIWKYKSDRDIGALIIELVAGLALIPIAFFMNSDRLETSFLSYYLALGISLVLVIFFAVGLIKYRTTYSIIQLSIAIAFLVAGLFLLGGIS
jgi:hypothetical protein